jgi:hypothetical protein
LPPFEPTCDTSDRRSITKEVYRNCTR